MKVLLINPKVSTGWKPYLAQPIGLGYLSACIQKHQLAEVKIVDMGNNKISSIKDEILEFVPDMVGITVFTEARFYAVDVLNMVKSMDNSIITVAGGVHASCMAEQLLKNYHSIDIIC